MAWRSVAEQEAYERATRENPRGKDEGAGAYIARLSRIAREMLGEDVSGPDRGIGEWDGRL